jgi:hypothetical protein
VDPISLKEVSTTVKAMALGKYLGSNGFKVDFFQSYWPIIEVESWKVFEESHISGNILHAFNTCFILKEYNPQTVDKFRPISLCNTIPKVIYNIIANRLKPILHKINSLEHGGIWKDTRFLMGLFLPMEPLIL